MIVKFTPKAERRLLEIFENIKEKFGEKVAKKFSMKMKNFIEIIALYPNIGANEKKEYNIRGFQLTKQTKIFYRIKKENITILNLFDVRQSPKNKKY